MGILLTSGLVAFSNFSPRKISEREKNVTFCLLSCASLGNKQLNDSCTCSVLSVMSNSVQPYGLYATRLLCPWDSPGKNTGVRCHALLQGILPTEGSNPRLLCLLHCQAGSFVRVPPGKSVKQLSLLISLLRGMSGKFKPVRL